MVVADLALSPESRPRRRTRGSGDRFPVLDLERLAPPTGGASSGSRPRRSCRPTRSGPAEANPELAASWVAPVNEGWRRAVLGAGS